MARNLTGMLVAFALSVAAFLSAAWLVAPQSVLQAVGLADAPKEESSGGGWGAAAPEPEAAAPWIDLSNLKWMAWTPETGAFFLFIVGCLALMTALELRRPGGHPRQGVLGLETTRGDRLFITLLGSAWIILLWVAVMGTPIWGGIALAIVWASFIFWKA